MNRKERGKSRGKEGEAEEKPGKSWRKKPRENPREKPRKKPGNCLGKLARILRLMSQSHPHSCQPVQAAAFQERSLPPIDSHWGMLPSKGVLLLLPIVLQTVLAFNAHDYALPLSRRFPAEPPQSRRSSSPPGQKPGPPSIRPPIVDEELGRMLERTRAFVRRYLTPSDVRHLQERITRAKMAGAGRERIRHVVWHFLTDALSPEQKMELAVEKSKLMMDFARH